jgi:hypothetical protein
MRVELGNVIAKSESGSAVADIYTVIYDESELSANNGILGEQSLMRALYTTNKLRRRDQDTMT